MENKRIYLLSVMKEYRNILKTDQIHCDVYDSIEEALESGKLYINENVLNSLYGLYDKDVEVPENITHAELIKYMWSNKLRYYMQVDTISTCRKKFKSCKELMEYFNDNIDKISNNDLYDFLLSLVTRVKNIYNHNGKKINFHWIEDQIFEKDRHYEFSVDFNEDDCKKGLYIFSYCASVNKEDMFKHFQLIQNQKEKFMSV